MNSMVSIGLVIVGMVLVVMGVGAMDSFGSDASRLFTGAPTDMSVWMFIAALLALIAGGVTATFQIRAAASSS